MRLFLKYAQTMAKLRLGLCCMVFMILLPGACFSQEPPYFVTYSQVLEEPGNLEVSLRSAIGTPQYGNQFRSATLELEYGAKGWWTTEFYLSGQNTANDSTIFTGYRWENRFRPLPREHFINPVLYVEYENLNAADRSLLEVVGNDNQADLRIPNAVARQETERSLETKLILSSNVHAWNISENFIAEKDLNESGPWEFGYAVGVSRPLTLTASAHECVFCRERFAAGAELYGGLGTTDGFGLKSTSQYAGPTISYDIPKGPTATFGVNFGLTDNSVGTIYRFKLSYEIEQVFRAFKRAQ